MATSADQNITTDFKFKEHVMIEMCKVLLRNTQFRSTYNMVDANFAEVTAYNTFIKQEMIAQAADITTRIINALNVIP